MFLLLAILISYLLGSLSTSIIASKLANSPDPRTNGSNNPGATNMLRTSGKKLAIITLFGDILKGTIVVSLSVYSQLFNDPEIFIIAAFCFIGHIYPIYYKFNGGKGVAVTLGLILAINPLLAGIGLISWLCIAYISKYSSLSAILTAPILTLIAFFNNQYTLTQFMAFITVMLWITHKENIKKLLTKTESKISFI